MRRIRVKGESEEIKDKRSKIKDPRKSHPGRGLLFIHKFNNLYKGIR
jgi:hypothetical protein